MVTVKQNMDEILINDEIIVHFNRCYKVGFFCCFLSCVMNLEQALAIYRIDYKAVINAVEKDSVLAQEISGKDQRTLLHYACEYGLTDVWFANAARYSFTRTRS
jgi:hypothetical protein